MAIRRLAGMAGLVAIVLTFAAATAPVAAPSVGAEGGIIGAGNPSAIKNSYLVALDGAATRSTGDLAGRLAAKYGARVDHTYRHALHGFAGTMCEKAARRLAAEPGVSFVEQNRAVSLAATQSPVPSWGLDRIDQRNLPLNGSYSYLSTASNVTAYIIDTGIRTTHTTFGGRAVWGTNTVDANNSDCNGHGTHVAGTVGGSEYGVAKGVRLVAVKVLDCSGFGTFAGIAAGVDWVTGNHAAGAPAVANMSLGGSGTSPAVEAAVASSIADGVTYAIAAGNNGSDACNFTPARVTQAITVNASDASDNRATFSNFGTCTDLFAPGVAITSAWGGSNAATNTISGTSMATPHVAGGAALILGASPGATPAEVASALLTNATPNKITSPGAGSPNLLLFVNSGGCAGCPIVNHPGNRAGRAGIADSVQLTASGGSTPYTWSATGLPAGLSINSATGLISGTPTTAAAHTVTVTATDTASRAGSTSFGWTVNPNLDGTWSCTIPIGYTWTRVANEYNVCAPSAWAYRYQLRWPVDNAFNACAVPAGFTWSRVITQYGVCNPAGYANEYWLRKPADGIYACTVPDGFTWSLALSQSGFCNPSGLATSYALRAPGNNVYGCSVPAGYTWDRVFSEYGSCNATGWATKYNLRVPATGLWACYAPPGWTHDAVDSRYGVCNATAWANSLRLTR